ncbi:ribonuclease E inhibitor RraB [Citromicrobium bathyomarinum]|uniref:ribonuclease E inhibitor RraB n=1 Tax=Citromicrobium bathyomarinum TaxID=72174 RepID=UPI00315B22EC
MSVSDERLAAEWATDDEVLRSLASNGDQPEIVRSVDVSFIGDQHQLEALAKDFQADGFELAYWSETDAGEPWLFLKRIQKSDRATIHSMTRRCLQAAEEFGVEHDGWGCMAHNANGPIDNENPA